MEELFIQLPLAANIALLVLSLYVVIRASQIMVDGAVSIAHLFNISPLVIGATVVAMGTSFAELAVNLVVVIGGGETSTVVGNILGSNLVNIGVELGISALIAGLIIVPREAFEKDIPLYIAATGMVTALIVDGSIDRFEAIVMLLLFIVALSLIIQYAKARHMRSELVVEVTPLEGISHPDALTMSKKKAISSLFGGLLVLVVASRLLILNTSAIAVEMNVPWFIIGLIIIGPGTSLPEIASSLQAARRRHAELVLGTAFGSNLFNLLFGLGLPALIRPLEVEDTAVSSIFFINFINISFLALLLMDRGFTARKGSINRVIGSYLVVTYFGFISYFVVDATGGDLPYWLSAVTALAALIAIAYGTYRWGIPRLLGGGKKTRAANIDCKILCATRGGQASQPTHARAIQIAGDMNAEIVFLYVFDKNALPREATPLVINVEAQIRHMQQFLDQTAARQAEQAGVHSRVIVRAGSLLEQIQSIAREEEIAVAILGNPKERSGLFKRDALRSMAKEIASSTGMEVIALIDDAEESYVG
jgi:cation:H+ antiporter